MKRTGCGFIGRGNHVANHKRCAGHRIFHGLSRQPRLRARSHCGHPVSNHSRSRRVSNDQYAVRIGTTRDSCLGLVEKYQDRRFADRLFDLAWTHNQVVLRQINATEATHNSMTPCQFCHLRQSLFACRR